MPRRTASDKLLQDKTFNIAKNSKAEWYQRELASMVFDFFFIKSLLVVLLHVLSQGTLATRDKFVINKCQIKPKQQLPKESHKTIVTKIENWKVY